MSTPRQVAANRANAQASTGPRSGAGKSRSAQNARRHGLAIPVWFDPKLAAEIEELTVELAGDNASSQIKALARAIAEAQIDLRRVRQARHGLLETALATSALLPTNQRTRLEQVKALIEVEARLNANAYIPWALRRQTSQPTGEARFARVISDLAGSLNALDRYERHALSRRNTAVAAFDAMRVAPDNSAGAASSDS